MQHPTNPAGQPAAPIHHDTEYSLRVRALEAQGMSTSDAQAIADVEDLDDVTAVTTTAAGAVDPALQRDALSKSVGEALRLIALGRIGDAQIVLHTAQEQIDEQLAAGMHS